MNRVEARKMGALTVVALGSLEVDHRETWPAPEGPVKPGAPIRQTIEFRVSWRFPPPLATGARTASSQPRINQT